MLSWPKSINNKPETNRLVFLHIHKCGGSSLQRLIRINYQRGLLTRAYRKLKGRGVIVDSTLLEKLKHSASHSSYLMGHFCFGIHRHLPGKSQYLTMLREPRNRLISLYQYSKRNPHAQYHRAVKDQSFEEFMTSGRVLETDNGIVRFLSGDDNPNEVFINRKSFGSIAETDLMAAISNVENHFTCVGFVEHFDQSVLLFNHHLKLKKTNYLVLNKTSEDELKPSWNSRFEKNIEYDQRLYDYFLERFKRECKSVPGLDDVTMQRFRTQNRQYQQRWGHWHQRYTRFRQI